MGVKVGTRLKVFRGPPQFQLILSGKMGSPTRNRAKYDITWCNCKQFIRLYRLCIINDDLIELGNEKGAGVSVRLPSNKVMPRRTSSRDLLRGGVIRRQSSKDLRSAVLMKRQSSRDMVNGGPKNVTKDPRICLIKRQSSQDLCNDRFTIRRDSINGLRIVSRDPPEDCDSDTIQRLGDINISDDKREFTKFQLEALKTHNLYRREHQAPSMGLDAELCKRSDSSENLLFGKIYCTFPILNISLP